MNFVLELSGFIALITSIIGLLPQMIKSLRTRSMQDVSMLMLVNYAICSLAWIIYGYATSTTIVIFSNVIGLLSSIILVGLKKNYTKKECTP